MYSQTPCADAVTVDVTDTRSTAQKAQADALTRRDAASANALEKARLHDEAQAQADSQAVRRANDKAAKAAKATTKKTADKKGAGKKKKKEPDYFTARETGAKKTNPAD